MEEDEVLVRLLVNMPFEALTGLHFTRRKRIQYVL